MTSMSARRGGTFDLEGYLDSKGFAPKGQKGEWLGKCPHCRKKKISVSVPRRQWHCWVCQEHEYVYIKGGRQKKCIKGGGGVIKLVAWLDDMTFGEAAQIVGEQPRFIRPRKLKPEYVTDMMEAPSWKEIAPPEGWQPLYEVPPYLAARGLTLVDIQAFGLVWCPTGYYQNRVVFPVWSDSKLVYWQARALYESTGDNFVKALNCGRPRDKNKDPLPGYAVSSDVLMNLDRASTFPRVAIVEGPMDLLRTGLDAVCCFGKQLSAAQIMALVHKGVQAVDLIFDHDAQADMIRVAEDLEAFFEVRCVYLPWGDPADHGPQAVAHYRTQGSSVRGSRRRLPTL